MLSKPGIPVSMRSTAQQAALIPCSPSLQPPPWWWELGMPASSPCPVCSGNGCRAVPGVMVPISVCSSSTRAVSAVTQKEYLSLLRSCLFREYLCHGLVELWRARSGNVSSLCCSRVGSGRMWSCLWVCLSLRVGLVVSLRCGSEQAPREPLGGGCHVGPSPASCLGFLASTC